MGICKRYTLVLLLKNMALTTKDGYSLYYYKIIASNLQQRDSVKKWL